MSTITLRPDKSLLCSDFDGYKLSIGTDQRTIYTRTVPDGVCSSSSDLKGSRPCSYLHTRLDALHNCLTPDLLSTNGDESLSSTVYCFTKRGQLLAYDYNEVLQEERLCDSRVVWQAELSENAAHAPCLLLQQQASTPDDSDSSMFGALPPSLCLASASLAVVCDGRQRLCLLHTGDRGAAAHHTWLTVFCATIGACEVVDARVVSRGNLPDSDTKSSQLHVLLVGVAPPSALPVAPPPQLSSSPSLHIITWLTLSSNDGQVFSVERERLYLGAAALEYCQFDEDCSAVVLLTHQHYYLQHDSDRPELLEESSAGGEQGDTGEEKQKEEGKKKCLYVYKQTDEDVSVRLQTGVSNLKELRISVTASQLSVCRDAGGDNLLTGTFLLPVDPDTVTWTLVDDSVEVTVSKAVAGERWTRLLQEEDLVGEEELGGKDRLDHLTVQDWSGNNELSEKPDFNPGQLESCDDAESDLLMLVLEGGGDGSIKTTPRALLGNTQYLATMPSIIGEPAQFCLRHDVDGVVWKVGCGALGSRFSHTATFNAFGYVRAGKAMAKFTTAPADCSYIAVCDVRSHVYLFCQPLPLGGELKNRRTGKITSKMARHILLSVPSHDEILGIVTLPTVIFVCTNTKLYAYALHLQEP